jgi:hypothetical protein
MAGRIRGFLLRSHAFEEADSYVKETTPTTEEIATLAIYSFQARFPYYFKAASKNTLFSRWPMHSGREETYSSFQLFSDA